MPQEGVDVLVATPGRVATLLEAEVLDLEDCRAVILDEVRRVPLVDPRWDWSRRDPLDTDLLHTLLNPHEVGDSPASLTLMAGCYSCKQKGIKRICLSHMSSAEK